MPPYKDRFRSFSERRGSHHVQIALFAHGQQTDSLTRMNHHSGTPPPQILQNFDPPDSPDRADPFATCTACTTTSRAHRSSRAESPISFNDPNLRGPMHVSSEENASHLKISCPFGPAAMDLPGESTPVTDRQSRSVCGSMLC